MGFEPTVPYGITGFQDQRLQPLGQLSEQRSKIITRNYEDVKMFSLFCESFFKNKSVIIGKPADPDFLTVYFYVDPCTFKAVEAEFFILSG